MTFSSMLAEAAETRQQPPVTLLSLKRGLVMNSQARNRVVVFRLSEDEYHMLTEACEHRGGRNLSEFTRTEVLDYLNVRTLPNSPHLHVTVLEQEIACLKTAVMQLNDLVAASRAGSTPSVPISYSDPSSSRPQLIVDSDPSLELRADKIDRPAIPN